MKAAALGVIMGGCALLAVLTIAAYVPQSLMLAALLALAVYELWRRNADQQPPARHGDRR